MARQDKYSIQDFKKDFPTEESCLTLIFNTLHSSTCSCGGTYKQIKGRKQYQCSKCRFQIAPASTTIFHKSDTPLSLWFHAIWVFSNAKSGISAKEMERQLGVTYKCAWRILSLIRKALKQPKTRLKGTVEIDTGFFGGRHYGGKNNEQLGRAMAKKAVVIIAAERGGQIRAEVAPDAKAETMKSFIERNVHTQISKLITDNSGVYKGTDKRYERESVNHSKGEYVRGLLHINTVETFLSHLKRSIRGTYKAISKQHLQSYLDAFVFHRNNSGTDRARFGVLMDTLLHASI